MLLKDVIKRVNKLVGNGSSFRLHYKQLEPYIDSSIDYVCNFLRIHVPTPSEDWEDNIILYSIIYSDNYKGIFDPNTNNEMGCFYYNKEFNKYTYYASNGLHYDIDLTTGEYIVYDIELDEEEDKQVPIIEDILSVIDKYDYNLLADDLIRSSLTYLIASSYLEEEDELEAQYRVYKERADSFLKDYRAMHYSCLDCYW